MVKKVDKKNFNLSFTLIAAVFGFMLAIQFQTVKKPVERDTRDTWQLREALLNEKELQSNLLSEIRSNEKKLLAYHSKQKQSREIVLKDTLKELKQEAGLTKDSGPGITLVIDSANTEIKPGDSVTHTISPELLQRLVNELNMYEAKYISIDGQRIINTTVIRDINGETKIDGHSIRSLPMDVNVVVENYSTAEKIYNRMSVSKARDEFFMENLNISISKPSSNIAIPAYEQPIRIRYMEPANEEDGS